MISVSRMAFVPSVKIVAVVLQRERVIGAERHHERRVEEQRVEVDDHERNRRADGEEAVAHRGGDAVERRLARALAGDRHVEAPAHPVPLQQEDDERGDEQRERQRGAAAQIEEPGDLQIRLRGQDRKLVAGEDERRGEVRERRREQQQERVGEAGNRERQRHRAKHAPAGRAERERHSLDVRVDCRQDRAQREVGDREVGERFGEEGARQAVDRHSFEPEQFVGDEPARPERKDDRDRRRERRGDERQQHARVDDAEKPSRQPAARGGEREQEAERRSQRADQRGEEQAVPESANLMAIGQDRREAGRGDRAVVGQHPREQHRERIHDEQREQEPQRQRRDGDGGVPVAAAGRRARRRWCRPRYRSAYGFRTSAIQRSTMRFRLAPA